MGVDPKIIEDTNATISVKQYSIFFRILFNSSFLSRTNSEYALSLLSKTEFGAGLRSGVPENILIAHKFGERTTQDGLNQLHDCGIVYYPDHPYLLCVMSRGENLHNLIDSIKKTSEFVYKTIQEQYKD